MITKEQAVALPCRAELHHVSRTAYDKKPMRCRVNGVCVTWKTRPADFRLPVVYGLRGYFYITPDNAADWTLPLI
jgi:hypothetical protein